MYIHKNKAREYKENCGCNMPLLLVGYGIFSKGNTLSWWYWEVVEPQRHRALEAEVRVFWDKPLKGVMGLWSLYFFSLLPGCHQVSSFAPRAPHHNLLHCHRPETTEAENYWLKCLKLWVKKQAFPLLTLMSSGALSPNTTLTNFSSLQLSSKPTRVYFFILSLHHDSWVDLKTLWYVGPVIMD